jgi:hypothetical protein
MKIIFPLIIIIFLILVCCNSTGQNDETEPKKIEIETVFSLTPTTKKIIPKVTPSNIPTPSPLGNATVKVNLANLRSGPGTTFEVVGSRSLNDILPIYGKDNNSEWIIIDWIEGIWISTTIVNLDVDINTIPIYVNENSISPSLTLTPSQNSQITSTTPTLVDVPSLLGKTIAEVESIIGKTILITSNDDNDDSTAGGEYRDYYIGDYLVFISFDKNGISRIFTVLEGLEAEKYSLQDWKILLPRFGIYTDSEPDRKAQTLYSWSNQNGLYIGIASISSKGYPIWTVKIAQQGYE